MKRREFITLLGGGAAWPRAPADRSPFLEAVVQALQAEPTIGNGSVHRIGPMPAPVLDAARSVALERCIEVSR